MAVLEAKCSVINSVTEPAKANANVLTKQAKCNPCQLAYQLPSL